MPVWKARTNRIDPLVDFTEYFDRNHITVAGTSFTGFPAEGFLFYRRCIAFYKIIFYGIKKCAA